MKKIITRSAGIALASLISMQVMAYDTINSPLTSINKEKPVPKYSIDLANKKIIFEDVQGDFLIDNEHGDVVLKGKVVKIGQTVDLAKLTKGNYMIEINHLGYIFTDSFEIL